MKMSNAFEVTEDDVANVLSSNQLGTPLQPGQTIESLAEEHFPNLDFELIEEAALMGDDLDEKTDYANDEIARQLRDSGILAPAPFPAAFRPSSQ